MHSGFRGHFFERPTFAAFYGFDEVVERLGFEPGHQFRFGGSPLIVEGAGFFLVAFGQAHDAASEERAEPGAAAREAAVASTASGPLDPPVGGPARPSLI